MDETTNKKNPTINEKRPTQPIKKYPITLICVLKDYEEARDKRIQTIKQHCFASNIMFETRIYDSYKYLKDRDEITSLPAFHIYVNSFHHRTFYPETRPLQHINEVIKEYLDKLEKKRKQKESWRTWFEEVCIRIKLLGKRKSKLEKAEAEKHRPIRRESFIERYKVSFVDTV